MTITRKMTDITDSLEKTDAFFCFIRSWWDGAGIDAALDSCCTSDPHADQK